MITVAPTKRLAEIAEMTWEEINTDMDYLICDKFDICIDQLDRFPLKCVQAVREVLAAKAIKEGHYA